MKSGSEESDRGARALAGHSMISPGEEVTAIITALKHEWTVQCYRFVTMVFVCFREHPIMELISLYSFSVTLIGSSSRLLIVFVVLQHDFGGSFFYLTLNIHLYKCGCGLRCV